MKLVWKFKMFIEDIIGKKSEPKDIKDPAKFTKNPKFSFKKSRTDNIKKPENKDSSLKSK